MKSEVINTETLIKGCNNADRILLINPPVVEARYQWVRWNQPLDLLKMSSFLKKEVGCDVRLYDFMLPIGGKVTRTANKPENELIINGGEYSYPLWRYGAGNDKFHQWLNELRATGWQPTQIWVTSLTSYWWLGVSSTITLIKSVIPDVKVVLYGQYPNLETAHAQENSYADTLIVGRLDLTEFRADFELYEKAKPAFCGLDVRSLNWHEEVVEKYKKGINDFVFFNDDILDPANDILQELRLLVKRIKLKSNRRVKFHGICGIQPSRFTLEIAKAMKEAEYVELHFEQQLDDKHLDIDAYKRAREAYHSAGFQLGPDDLSGFLFIGTPNDDFELIIRHMLNLLEIWGTVILKPYSPTPGTPDYERYRHIFENQEIEKLTPHAFPFSRVNGIAHVDYDELYLLAAVLNHKVKNKSFNSFPGTLGFQMIRTSLEREVWNLANEERATH